MSKKTIEPINVLLNGDMSLASLTSSSSTVKYMDNVAYQTTFSGAAPIGVLDIQVSQDGISWSNLGINQIINANSPTFIDVNQTGAAQIRAVYTRTSGTGTLNIVMTSKEV